MSWPWHWYGTGPAITESQAARIRAEAAARGTGICCIEARIVPDREIEAEAGQ
jgi:hypothetical protein